MNTLVIGSQWGDEGKGKVIDFLTEDADIVVRSQGGSNAGHTVIATVRNTCCISCLPASSGPAS